MGETVRINVYPAIVIVANRRLTVVGSIAMIKEINVYLYDVLKNKSGKVFSWIFSLFFPITQYFQMS